MPWPARCPDFTPCDFFVWGYVKFLVNRNGPVANLENLKKRIQDVCTVIDDMRKAVFYAYLEGCRNASMPMVVI